jgi:protocatechuate 3,4-dioxygenase beta subunit
MLKQRASQGLKQPWVRIRPPHIHVKVAAPGHRALTTQWYFEGVSFYYGNRTYDAAALRGLNQRDQVLGAVPLERRRDVIALAQRVGPASARLFRATYTLRLEPD